MSSVKISGLNPSSNLNVNPAHSIFPTTDTDTGDTTKISAKDLGTSLYSNNTLIVGSGGYVLPNLVAQFTGVGPSYVQVNSQNLNANGTCDYVTTADIGSDVNYYIDLGITNSNYSNVSPYNSLGTLIEPLSGYLYVQGNYGTGLSGNLVIGTTGTGTETRLFAGGITAQNVISKITTQGIEIQDSKWLKFGDGTYQTTAAAPNNYTRSAYSFANNVNVFAYSAYAFANTVNTSVYTANTFLQANDAVTLNVSLNYTDSANSFLRSNDNVTLSSAKSYTDIANTYIQSNYLANTTGTFNGTLRFTGSVNSNGFISIINPNVTDNTVFLKITAAANGASQPPSNRGYTVHTTSIDREGNRIVADAFGPLANNYASFIGRRGRGTAESPTALQSGDVIARFAGNGFGDTKFSQYGDGRIEIVAAENFTDTSKRTKIDFLTTISGSNTANIIASFNSNTVTFTGSVEPQKGFVFTPRVLQGAQTAITIDFTNDSMIRATLVAPLTISLSNYTYGKVVEMWLTNTDNQNRAVTHGCQANNSTLGTTSFTLNAGRSAYLRYFSIDGDSANTFVTINYQ